MLTGNGRKKPVQYSVLNQCLRSIKVVELGEPQVRKLSSPLLGSIPVSSSGRTLWEETARLHSGMREGFQGTCRGNFGTPRSKTFRFLVDMRTSLPLGMRYLADTRTEGDASGTRIRLLGRPLSAGQGQAAVRRLQAGRAQKAGEEQTCHSPRYPKLATSKLNIWT